MNYANNEMFPRPLALTFPCQGGMDLLSPSVAVPPGTLQDCWNYEVSINSGYTLASGIMLWAGKTFNVFREWIECPVVNDIGLDDLRTGGIYFIQSVSEPSKTARIRILRKGSGSVALQVFDGEFK